MYASLDDLIAQFGRAELQILAGNRDGSLDEDRIRAALIWAASEADSYLGLRYPVPVAGPPAMLVSAVGDMARYRLSVGQQLETESICRRYQEAVAWLVAIARGEAGLPIPRPDGGDAAQDARFCPGEREWRHA